MKISSSRESEFSKAKADKLKNKNEQLAWDQSFIPVLKIAVQYSVNIKKTAMDINS